MIAIVVPFFQRTRGLLRQAVESILAQQTECPWHLVVVDDGSPVHPWTELEPLLEKLAGKWTLIRQGNQGASAARNRALDHVAGQYDVVAFLESDDCWAQGHLERIRRAFAAGADFYFENCRRYDGERDRFEHTALRVEGRRCIDADAQLYWYDGDFFDALLRGSPVGTPTVADRISHKPDVRFRTDLTYCEDIFFWMQVSQGMSRIAFSPINGVFCGKGVNISEAAWGSLEAMKKFASLCRYYQLVEEGFQLNEAQKRWTGMVLRGLDTDFWRSTIAASARRDYRCLPMAASYLRSRPVAAGRIPKALAHSLQDRLFHSTAQRHPGTP